MCGREDLLTAILWHQPTWDLARLPGILGLFDCANSQVSPCSRELSRDGAGRRSGRTMSLHVGTQFRGQSPVPTLTLGVIRILESARPTIATRCSGSAIAFAFTPPRESSCGDSLRGRLRDPPATKQRSSAQGVPAAKEGQPPQRRRFGNNRVRRERSADLVVSVEARVDPN
jgi:hypothetical protein